jgi:hypothetical protein
LKFYLRRPAAARAASGRKEGGRPRQRPRAHQEEALAAEREAVVRERRRPLVGVDDVARARVQEGDPARKLERVRQRRGEEDHPHLGRHQDDHLLPDDAALAVLHVVHLVEDDPRDLQGF